MVNFLYWNLHNNFNIEMIISNCILENEIDVAIFSEYKNINVETLIYNLESKYCVLEGCGECEKVIVVYQKALSISMKRQQHRYLMAELSREEKKFIIVGVHLPSNPNSNSSDRKHVIRSIIDDIVDAEKEDIYSSVIIGDMNASPFDAEMVEKDAFNAVLFKQLIKEQEFVQYQGDNFKRFYNPSLDYIKEENQNYGSFYYGASIDTLYWYCYDQVLVRKTLVDNIKRIAYLKYVNGVSLIKTVRPNDAISDHLPMLVKIDI